MVAVIAMLAVAFVGSTSAPEDGEGRAFPITVELRRILEAQQEIAKTVKREHGTIPR